MAIPQNWPPSDSIEPLLTSFHITHDFNSKDTLFTPKALEFYKRNEPIGCRDYYTVELMKSHGVDAYYSSCLTLTLNRDNFTSDKSPDDKIYFVDVLYKVGGLSTNFFKRWKWKWIIRQIFPPELLEKAEFMTQVVPKKTSEEKKFKIAQEALEKYARAGQVITSRIHCALPCTAFGTRVLFIDGGLDENTDTTRLQGVAEYFNSVNVGKVIKSYRGFLKEYFAKFTYTNPLNIDWDNLPDNPNNHLEVASKLQESCRRFVDSDF